ncbi:serine hydrolase domain-containing protein [Mycolicibacterium hippocampi]|uniref:serine hydrolase domain-containing protein n=1 Tax=Mycolicibacterium hippocampi TaxID=659824 RepID=UPI003518755E
MTVPGSRFGRAFTVAAVLLALGMVLSCESAAPPPPATTSSATPATAPASAPPAPTGWDVTAAHDFAAVSQLVDDAIAARRLPGAVVQIGHAGKIVFHQAFGVRKLAGEPGLDGAPSPAEPMTEDTIFDLASLTKSIATATAVLQLHEQGRVRLDEPVQSYLPRFNPAGDPRRAQVTLRMLLTHTSGIAGDLSLDGPWGLDKADKADGIRRALAALVVFDPGLFHYSDINFILLGVLVEKLTGEPIDVYVEDNVFTPLGMTDTHYFPQGTTLDTSPKGTSDTNLLARVAPTARNEDSRDDPARNPDYFKQLRGTVHDPTARRMGGVTGSAGVFSTAADVGRFAQALLDRLAGRPSTFPLTQSTLELMTTPQQPGHTAEQLEAANTATRNAIAPSYPAVSGQNLRGFGWDIDTAQSRPRGTIFPIGSFGHTGFTGTTLWIDPGSDTYVVVLSNVIHQRGGPPIAALSGQVATAAARVLRLYGN